MATTLYPTSAASTYAGPTLFNAGETLKKLALTRGGGATSENDPSGFAPPAWWGDPGSLANILLFISEPLNAVTISGNITANVRALETNAMANAGVGIGSIFRVNDSTGLASPAIASDQYNTASELGTSESARTISAFSPTSTNIASGERIGVAFGWAAVGTAAAGYTLTGFYSGPTAAASGDTYVTFTETITESSGGGNTYTKSGYGRESA